jgi:hypothetical protein
MSSYKRLRIWMLALACLLESIQNSRRARRDAAEKKKDSRQAAKTQRNTEFGNGDCPSDTG